MAGTMTPTLTPIFGRFGGAIYRYFWRRWPERCVVGKAAWVAYATIATVLIAWDASEIGDHLGNTLIVMCYCFPSYLLAALLASFTTMHNPSPVFVWVVTITFNGWLVFRLFCGFRKRSLQMPNQSTDPTFSSGTPGARHQSRHP